MKACGRHWRVTATAAAAPNQNSHYTDICPILRWCNGQIPTSFWPPANLQCHWLCAKTAQNRLTSFLNFNILVTNWMWIECANTYHIQHQSNVLIHLYFKPTLSHDGEHTICSRKYFLHSSSSRLHATWSVTDAQVFIWPSLLFLTSCVLFPRYLSNTCSFSDTYDIFTSGYLIIPLQYLQHIRSNTSMQKLLELRRFNNTQIVSIQSVLKYCHMSILILTLFP